MAVIMIVEDDRQTNDAVSEYLKSFVHFAKRLFLLFFYLIRIVLISV